MKSDQTKDELQLPAKIRNEIQSFHDSIEGDLSDKTVEDYTIYIKGFYKDRLNTTGVDTGIIRLSGEAEFMEARKAMKEFIDSRATEYGLKKYCEFLDDRADSYEEVINAHRLKDEIHGTGKKSQQQSKKSKVKKKILPFDKVKKIVQNAPNHTETLPPTELELFLQVMYETAGRVGDILQLQWHDIGREELGAKDLDETELVIAAERSKSKNDGVVEIESSTLDRVQRHKQQRGSPGSGERVFFADEPDLKKLYNRIAYAFNTAAEDDADHPHATTHWFRHSRLTHLGQKMLADGKSYPEVKERLRKYGRHDSSDVTETYIEVLKDKDTGSIQEYSQIEWEE